MAWPDSHLVPGGPSREPIPPPSRSVRAADWFGDLLGGFLELIEDTALIWAPLLLAGLISVAVAWLT